MAADAVPERDWTALPQPILQLFGRHLSAPGLKHALSACKSWREPVRHGVESFALSFPAADPQQADGDSDLAASLKLGHLAATFPHLTQLQLTLFSDPDSCLAPLASLGGALPALQELRLCFRPEEDSAAPSRRLHEVLAPLGQLTQLTSLHLEMHTEFADWSWLRTVAALTQLQSLVLRLNLQAPSAAVAITDLQPLTALRHFELHMAFIMPPSGALPDATISDAALEQLASSWPQLRSLTLTASPWDFAPLLSSGLKQFRALEALCLSVEEPYEYADQPPAPAICVQVGSLPDSLLAARFSNAGVLSNANVPNGSLLNLAILELLSCEYDKKALAACLSGCPQLRSMVVDRVTLTGEGLVQWLQQ